MNSIFDGGMTALSAFVGCFNLNPLGYPRVAMGSPSEGWHPETLTAANHGAFLDGTQDVLEDALRFSRRLQDQDMEIPGTMWKLALDGPDRFRLWRPRYSIHFDLSPMPWTDVVELRKEYSPPTGSRRSITQKFRRTRSDAERFRDIKEMNFARVELGEEFGQDQRALGMLEHQLTMQFNANVFQRVKATSGNAIALSAREPLIDRWKPYVSRAPAAKVDQEAFTPAQGVPATDPDYPYRVLYESDLARDYFRIYMSRRDPEDGALSLELGLRALWNRVETFVETTNRPFPLRPRGRP